MISVLLTRCRRTSIEVDVGKLSTVRQHLMKCRRRRRYEIFYYFTIYQAVYIQ